MGDFGVKIDRFLEVFIDKNGYVRVLDGLQNTLLIAITGLLIGIVIGTLIATVRVVPKYKTLPRVLNGICSFYVGSFQRQATLYCECCNNYIGFCLLRIFPLASSTFERYKFSSV